MSKSFGAVLLLKDVCILNEISPHSGINSAVIRPNFQQMVGGNRIPDEQELYCQKSVR
jgi:hypothetical protein